MYIVLFLHAFVDTCYILIIFRTMMVWNDGKDELLCREVLFFEPYQFKERTKERGNAWKAISESLNSITTQKFKVDARAV